MNSVQAIPIDTKGSGDVVAVDEGVGYGNRVYQFDVWIRCGSLPKVTKVGVARHSLQCDVFHFGGFPPIDFGRQVKAIKLGAPFIRQVREVGADEFPTGVV